MPHKLHSNITAGDKKKYPLPTKKDVVILSQCKQLLKKTLSEEDKLLVQFVLTQLKDDWRTPLLQTLQKLKEKYNKQQENKHVSQSGIDTTLPKNLLHSSYRKEMWKEAREMLQKLEKVIPIEEVYVLGSFVTKKKRPADVDCIILLQTKKQKKNEHWSFDMQVSPNNKVGKEIAKDAEKWMEQKYGKGNFTFIRLK